MSDAANAQRQPRCLKCDYALVGLADNRCPECGRAFDPHDPYTHYAAARPLNPWLRWFVNGPTWWLHGPMIAAALAMLYAASGPGYAPIHRHTALGTLAHALRFNV